MSTKVTKNLKFLSTLGLILMGGGLFSLGTSPARGCQCICWFKTGGLDYENPDKDICENENKDAPTCEACCRKKAGWLYSRTQCN